MNAKQPTADECKDEIVRESSQDLALKADAVQSIGKEISEIRTLLEQLLRLLQSSLQDQVDLAAENERLKAEIQARDSKIKSAIQAASALDSRIDDEQTFRSPDQPCRPTNARAEESMLGCFGSDVFQTPMG